MEKKAIGKKNKINQSVYLKIPQTIKFKHSIKILQYQYEILLKHIPEVTSREKIKV